MTADKKSNVEEIDLLKLAKALWHRAFIILICAMMLGAGAFYWTYRKVYTTYRSTALLYVNNNSLSLGSAKLSLSTGDIKAVNNLMETYSVILTSRTTLNEIISETGIPYAYEDLVKMIKTETVGDTAIFKISVTAEDPDIAAHIANSILTVLPSKISTVIEGASAQIVDYAVPGEAVVNGSPIKSAAIGALLGAVISSAVVIFMYMLDTKVRAEDFLLENYKDIPILTSVPNLNTSGKGGYYGYRKAYARGASKLQVQEEASSGTHVQKKEKSNMRPGNEGK